MTMSYLWQGVIAALVAGTSEAATPSFLAARRQFLDAASYQPTELPTTTNALSATTTNVLAMMMTSTTNPMVATTPPPAAFAAPAPMAAFVAGPAPAPMASVVPPPPAPPAPPPGLVAAPPAPPCPPAVNITEVVIECPGCKKLCAEAKKTYDEYEEAQEEAQQERDDEFDAANQKTIMKMRKNLATLTMELSKEVRHKTAEESKRVQQELGEYVDAIGGQRLATFDADSQQINAMTRQDGQAVQATIFEQEKRFLQAIQDSILGYGYEKGRVVSDELSLAAAQNLSESVVKNFTATFVRGLHAWEDTHGASIQSAVTSVGNVSVAHHELQGLWASITAGFANANSAQDAAMKSEMLTRYDTEMLDVLHGLNSKAEAESKKSSTDAYNALANANVAKGMVERNNQGISALEARMSSVAQDAQSARNNVNSAAAGR